MNVRRTDGYEGNGTRRDDGVRQYLPYVMTVLMFMMTTFVGALAFFYKEDRQNMKDLIVQVSETLADFRKDVDLRFVQNSTERTRVIENNEQDKKDIRKELSELKYKCCSSRRTN